MPAPHARDHRIRAVFLDVGVASFVDKPALRVVFGFLWPGADEVIVHGRAATCATVRCFPLHKAENTGNRQAQLNRPAIVPGGTIIFGGERTDGIILDLGNGELGSAGHNNFINTTGPHVRVETVTLVFAEHNWFGGIAPVSSGIGSVDFQPELA